MGKRRRIRTDGAPRIARPKINGRLADVWYVVWSEAGRSRRLSTGIAWREDVKQRRAKTWLGDWLAARERAALDDPTFEEIIDFYLDAREDAGIKSPETLRAHFVVIRAQLGHLHISAITDEAIKRFIDYLKNPPPVEDDEEPAFGIGHNSGAEPPPKPPKPRKPAAQGTINKKIRCIRQALRYGKRKKRYKVEMPDIDPVKRGQRRKRFLSKPEGVQLFNAARHPDTAPHIRLYVYLAVGIMQRQGAILALEWDRDIDFEHRIVWAAPGESDNKQRVAVPMSQGVYDELVRAYAARRTKFVIEYRDNKEPLASVKTGVRALVRRAKLKNVRTHDFRRTGASWAIMAGKSFAEVAAILGDTEKVVKEHYGHFSPEYLQGVADAVDPGLLFAPAAAALIEDRTGKRARAGSSATKAHHAPNGASAGSGKTE